jgi:hypothetical protein
VTASDARDGTCSTRERVDGRRAAASEESRYLSGAVLSVVRSRIMRMKPWAIDEASSYVPVRAINSTSTKSALCCVG